MSRLQLINRHRVLATVEINGVKLVSTTQDSVWTIIRLLKWLPDSIMPDKNMRCRAKRTVDVPPQPDRLPGGCAAKGAHVALESSDIAGGICVVLGPWNKELSGET